MEAAFNDKRVREAIEPLQDHQQLVFGAACCERMLPNYIAFMRESDWGDELPLRKALDWAWAACEGAHFQNADLRDLLSQAEKCTPDTDCFASLLVSAAQDAVFAICALLDFLLDADLERLMSVPRLSTDSVDLIVQERESMDARDPLREQKILEHPLMQQELVRQKRDLAEARNISATDRTALNAFRTRAQHESNLVVAEYYSA